MARTDKGGFMTEEQNNEQNNKERPFTIGCGGIFLLTIGFIVLKLCRVLDWAWVWVFSPLWLSVALLSVLVLVAFITGFFKR